MQIRLIPRENGIAEWAMIELQGTLEPPGMLSGQHIGKLAWNNNKALLHIGHHIMEGKEVKLENPFLVLVRNTEERTNVQVAAIIRKKVQFRNRPIPI
ncbi:unnamed protein product [Thelazia callipaeda]|uniref:Chromosome transmission fidelity protein 8 homolog n=1 Tax=Thelazia callipaeda TaxID=103827 RepID=A0A0N5D7M1_THECL|nr:unnamed protein product [Thelazia callipaeda]